MIVWVPGIVVQAMGGIGCRRHSNLVVEGPPLNALGFGTSGTVRFGTLGAVCKASTTFPTPSEEQTVFERCVFLGQCPALPPTIRVLYMLL